MPSYRPVGRNAIERSWPMNFISFLTAFTLVLLPPPLAPAPDDGVDPDLAAAMKEADHALSEQQPDRAYTIVVGVFFSSDPFSVAQSPRLTPRGASLLREVGELELSRGRLALAARSLDAAWELEGRRTDPRYSAVLVRWAEEIRREDKATALYLARRARVADPDNAAAASLDRRLSHNRLRAPGWTALSLSLVTLAASIAASTAAASATGGSETRYRRLAGAGYGATAGLYVLGIGLLWGGRRDYTPSSPKELPTLPQRVTP